MAGEPGRAAEVADVSIENLLLDVRTRGQHGRSTQIADALSGGHIEQTIVGASKLQLEVRDRKYTLLRSGIFDTRVVVNLDGTLFRMVEVSLIDDQQLRIVFEPAIISEMREHSKPLKAKRDTTTRAEFILKMMRELKMPFAFICPELHRRQAIGAGEAEVASAAENALTTAAEPEKESPTSAGRSPSLSKGNLTVKHTAISEAQVKLLTEALLVAEANGGFTRSMEALVVAMIQESNVSNPTTGDKDSVGVLQVRRSTAAGIQKADGQGTLDPMNVAEVVAHFMTAGYYREAGGANAIARAHPTWTVGQVAQACQGSAYPSYYDQWKDEAKAIVAAFTGGGITFSSPSVTAQGESKQKTAPTATYEYSRGRPGLVEDTWTCGLRLAEEVLWRLFVVARKSGVAAIYYVNEDDLIRAKPRYVVTPNTVGAGKLTFDAEVGKRFVVIRGRRQPKLTEARLEVRLGRWDAPPGTVIELSGYGVGDSKYLVDTVERDLYSATGMVHLKAPQKPTDEPLAGSVSTGSAGAEGGGATSPEVSAADKAKLAREHPELHQGVREVVVAILAKFPTLQITSTFRPGGTSYHALGRACDIAADSQTMHTAADWIGKTFTSVLVEGIHNPNLSVKEGHTVDPSFWGAATWAEHANHIHVAV